MWLCTLCALLLTTTTTTTTTRVSYRGRGALGFPSPEFHEINYYLMVFWILLFVYIYIW